MLLTYEETYRLLRHRDNFLILTHRNPDGDAVGSMFAMYYALTAMGKNVRCIIDTVPDSISFPVTKEAFYDFAPEHIITVDVADKKLLTEETMQLYSDRVLLAIDHHMTHVSFSEHLLLDRNAAAASEVIFYMLTSGGFDIPLNCAEALYLGISTDTGCFRYPNTTARTLAAASQLVALGVDNGEINRIVFETKTREYVSFEALAMKNLKTYYDGQCALMLITQEMYRKTGVSEADTHAINALPRQIEGVLAGVVVKEKKDGSYKVSLRTNEPLSAADICSLLGGGGHRLAAGCELQGSSTQVVNTVLRAVKTALDELP